MKEITMLPGIYHVGKDMPPGAYVFTLGPDAQYANLSLVKPIQYNWYMTEPFIKVRLRLEEKTVFRLDRPVTVRNADAFDFSGGVKGGEF